MPENCKYVNSGVMMMNLALLREQQNTEEVFEYIREYKNRLIFPDQDVINGLYGDRIIPIDPKIYNLSERYYLFYNLHPKNKEHKIDLEWVRRNTVIIHYCGKNKPWKENYRGKLGAFYQKFEQFIFKNGDREKEHAERFPAYRP